ncbi:MAG: S41 family peptidase [Planctomycetota bacterium]|nr:S41 family peptidase [Planctomycetota bacterium]
MPSRSCANCSSLLKKEEEPEKTEPKEEKPEQAEDGEAEAGNGEDAEDETADAEDEEEEAKPEPGDTIDTEDLFSKLRRLSPMLANSRHYVINVTKRGVAIVAIQSQGSLNLYALPVKNSEKAKPQPLTRVSGDLSMFSLDEQEQFLYYVVNGRLYRSRIGNPTPSPVTPATLTFPYDEMERREAVLDEAVWLMKWGFYDEELHGVDVDVLSERYHELVRQTVTTGNMQNLMWDFIGEFNASHMMFQYAGSDPQTGIVEENTPHLGFIYDDKLIEQGILQVRHIILNSPADKPGIEMKEGDFVLEINGGKVAAGVDIYKFLTNRANEEIELLVADTPQGENSRYVYLQPVDLRTTALMRRGEWVEMNRRYVEENSDGRFGYIYLASMLENDYMSFLAQIARYKDDYEGVVLDFRYNSGGFIAYRIAEYLDNEQWVFSKPRGGAWLEEQVLRDYGFDKPVVGMFNYASYSNAEMMAAAFNLLDLGPSVGMPTAGGVIGVSPRTLLDGSVMNLPSLRVEDKHGRNLERSPTKPSKFVEQDIADDMAGRQPQLDKAIEQLERQNGSKGEERRKGKKKSRPML